MSQATQTSFMDADTPNPYASPSPDVAPNTPSRDRFYRTRSLSGVFWVWLAVCAISAAPSFFFGLTIGSTPAHILGMVTGVFLFILVFTYLDFHIIHPKLKTNRRGLRTLRFGYGTRLVITFLIPVGASVDVLLGAISIGLISQVPVLGEVLNQGASAPARFSQGTIFTAILLTTILQGLLINIVIIGYMSLVWCILAAFGVPGEGSLTTIKDIEDDREKRLTELSNGTFDDEILG